METKHTIFFNRVAKRLSEVRRAKQATVSLALPGIALPGLKARVDKALAEHVFNSAAPGLSIPFAEAEALCAALEVRLGVQGGELNLVDAAALYRLAVGLDCADPIKTTMRVTGHFADIPLSFTGDFEAFTQDLFVVPELDFAVPHYCVNEIPALVRFGPVSADGSGTQSCTMSGRVSFIVTLTSDNVDGERPLTGATVKVKVFQPGGQPQHVRLTDVGVDDIEQQ